jgi:hypothetical protein
MSSFPQLRYRIDSDYKSTGYQYLWGGEPGVPRPGPSPWPSFRNHRYIYDVIGTPKTHRVKPMRQLSLQYVGLPFQTWYGDNGLYHKSLNPATLPPIGKEIFEDDAVFRPPNSLLSQAAGRAFVALSERFPTKIAFIEFLQGLRELGSLLPKFEKTLESSIASFYLNKKFGWDNLLSDLRSFDSLIGSIRQRMIFLRKTYGRPTKLYYREPEFFTKDSWSLEQGLGARGWGMRFIMTHFRCDYNAGCSLTQRLNHIDDAIGWLRAITISLGLNNPLKATWEVIPLSFVVDWFLDVSGHLRRLATVQPADDWIVSGLSSSYVLDARFSVAQVHTNLENQGDQVIPLGEVRMKRYERFTSLPVDLSIYTPSTLNPGQLVLLSAMAGSK